MKLLAMLLTGCLAAAALGDSIWIEGEDALSQDGMNHHGWYTSVRSGELSGGQMISHYGKDKTTFGTARYQFDVSAAKTYRFFLRCNPVQAAMSYRLNDGPWTKIPLSLDGSIDPINIAANGQRDMRFIAWVDVGDVTLPAGSNTIDFRTESDIAHHGMIDAFVFTDDPTWLPHGMLKPGEKSAASDVEAPPGCWVFNPGRDPFKDDALLDLSYLNEDTAGEHGFIRVNEHGDFVRGDGEPIRFWAVNTQTYRQGDAALRENARFLAKHGVNMVRWHGALQPKNPDQPLDSVDEQALDQVFAMVAAMKDEGIYLTLSPYYAHSINLKDKNGQALRQAWGLPRDSDAPNPTGLLFFDTRLQEAYKNWLRELFTRINPYTGKPLREEPAVAIFQIQNEDSLLFWTFDHIGGLDLDLLRRKFGQWLIQKYGSLDQARQAWHGAKAEGASGGDDWDRGLISFCKLWSLAKTDGSTSSELRKSDQAQFLTETMRDWNAEVARYLREDLHAPQVINAGNWRTADPLRLNDLERYSYTANQVLGLNRYTTAPHKGQYQGWAIGSGDRFDNRSVTLNPPSLPLAIKQAPDKAFINPEGLWVPPNLYQSEGPWLIAAYQSLTGVDAYYWFAMQQPQWRQPSSANGYVDALGMWVIATPTLMGNFPAAALMYRAGYVQQGKPVVVEHRALADMWQRRSPIISEEGTYDPNRDAADISDRSAVRDIVDRLAFLVGPVQVIYDSDPARTQVADLSPYIDTRNKIVISDTRQLHWDFGRGIVTLDAPCAKGAVGFLNQQKTFNLTSLSIESDDDYAAILVVSLDGKPLDESQRILVQVGTTARPNGWQQRTVTEKKDDQTVTLQEIVNHGNAPWMVTQSHVRLTLQNTLVESAVALDPNGYQKAPVEVIRDGEAIVLTVPADAMYVILQP